MVTKEQLFNDILLKWAEGELLDIDKYNDDAEYHAEMYALATAAVVAVYTHLKVTTPMINMHGGGGGGGAARTGMASGGSAGFGRDVACETDPDVILTVWPDTDEDRMLVYNAVHEMQQELRHYGVVVGISLPKLSVPTEIKVIDLRRKMSFREWFTKPFNKG